MELRYRGWVDAVDRAATFEYFRRNRLVWVATDVPPLDSPSLLPAIDEVTNPKLAYLRLHGRNPNCLKGKTATEKHHYEYSATDLEEIAGRIKQLAAKAADVHVSVNNHAKNFAPKAALALRRLLGQAVKGVNLENQEMLFEE